MNSFIGCISTWCSLAVFATMAALKSLFDAVGHYAWFKWRHRSRKLLTGARS